MSNTQNQIIAENLQELKSEEGHCPNCGHKLWQEHTKMWSRQNKDIDTNHAYTLIDNWHCDNCGSVFTNKELTEKNGN